MICLPMHYATVSWTHSGKVLLDELLLHLKRHAGRVKSILRLLVEAIDEITSSFWCSVCTNLTPEGVHAEVPSASA